MCLPAAAGAAGARYQSAEQTAAGNPEEVGAWADFHVAHGLSGAHSCREGAHSEPGKVEERGSDTSVLAGVRTQVPRIAAGNLEEGAV